MNPFSPYSPFFTSAIFLLVGAAMIGALCVAKALGAERMPALVRLNFFNVEFNAILQDDANFSRHVLVLLAAFISTILFTAVIASVQWILLSDLGEGMIFGLHTARLVLGLAICFAFSRRLPRR